MQELKELNEIRNELENALKDWKKSSKLQFNQTIDEFVNVVLKNDLEGFYRLNSYNLFSVLDDKGLNFLKDLVKNNTDWFNNKDVIKKLIIENNEFIRLVDNEFITLEILVEIFEKFDEKWLSKIWLRNSQQLDFNELLKDEKLLELFLSKNFNLSNWFKNVDLLKIPDKFYQNEKHWETILENVLRDNVKNVKVIIKKLPPVWMQELKLWTKFWNFALTSYELEIKKYITKEQLLTAKIIDFFITRFGDYSLINEYYDDFINNGELIKKLLSWGGNYNILKHIKDADFYKLRDIIIDRLEKLEDEMDGY